MRDAAGMRLDVRQTCGGREDAWLRRRGRKGRGRAARDVSRVWRN